MDLWLSSSDVRSNSGSERLVGDRTRSFCRPCGASKSCGSCGVVDVASLYAWELKLYFYPSAGGKKKKKEKKSLYASATPELSGCMIFGLLIVRASC